MDSAIDSIAQSMIARYDHDASYLAARRARVLETCNDRQSARTWFLISGRIDEIAPPLPTSDLDPWPDRNDRDHAPSAGLDREATPDHRSADDRVLVTTE
jgi:hypothetical protein